MADSDDLREPWLVAVWPGMGSVALGAGSYLCAKLGATWVADLPARDLFDIDHVEIKEGVTQVGRLPRNMFFKWKDPDVNRDLLIFVGEGQPSGQGYPFCHSLLNFAIRRGVKRFFTFAAMATQQHPQKHPRVFGVATEKKLLKQLQSLEVAILAEGQISGLNGVLLAAGADRGLQGTCLLGEMPYFAENVPNPKASMRVLEIFAKISGIKLDLSDLSQQAQAMDKSLMELMEKMNQAAGQRTDDSDADFTVPEFIQVEDEPDEKASEKPTLDLRARRHIEAMFERACRDRSTATELKRELDHLGVFKEYEDQFLDLFKKAE